MSDTPETRPVCPACGHVDGAHLNHCRIAQLERELAAVLKAGREAEQCIGELVERGMNDRKLIDDFASILGSKNAAPQGTTPMECSTSLKAPAAAAPADTVPVRRDILEQVIKKLDSVHHYTVADGLRILLVREP
jgi:hypothetical protein